MAATRDIGSGHLHQINLDGIVVNDFERDGLHRDVLCTQGRLASRFAYDGAGRRSAHPGCARP